jgi:hypothetical protein
VIGSTSYRITSGFTSSIATSKAEVTVSPAIGAVYPLNSTINLQTVGVTRGTSGIAGSTFETFPRPLGAGFTANIFYGTTNGTSYISAVS